MSERVVPVAELDGYVGQNISAICTFGFISEVNHHNHCAHFVSHLLSLRVGAKCAPKGVSIRVNEIFNRCRFRGDWDDLPTPRIYSLIFATQSTNMGHDGNMMNGPKKHMGIWSYPYVYDYSTMNHQVLKELVPDFLSRLDGVYNTSGHNPVRLFYGYDLPV
jgi:hypothetical protein